MKNISDIDQVSADNFNRLAVPGVDYAQGYGIEMSLPLERSFEGDATERHKSTG
jgi:hypothetical protein